MTTWDHMVAELQNFRARKEVVNALGKGLRAATKPARKAIKKKAKASLPQRGGLNIWVSKVQIRTQIRVAGFNTGVKLKGGRNSLGGRSDVARIDDPGRVRAPTYGRRTAGSWHTVTVTPGFFTKTAAELPDWVDECDKAVDTALDTIRRG